MPATPMFPLVDRVLDGQLAQLLHQWKNVDGLSVFQMTMKLRDDHDISVSPDTVARWIKKVAA